MKQLIAIAPDDRRYLAQLRERRGALAAEWEAIGKQIAALDKAIAALAALIPSDEAPPAAIAPPTQEAGTPLVMRAPAIWEQARDVLKEQARPLRIQEILDALKAKGVVIDSPNASNIIHTALSRHPETFAKLERGVWVLAELQSFA